VEEGTIIRCFSCGTWVREQATRVQKTGGRAEEVNWCRGCIREVDEYTSSIMSDEPIVPPLELEEGA